MRRMLGLAGCVLLGSCGNQTTAGGGSDQPNSVQAVIVLADGTPAAGAAARWVSGEWNEAETASVVDPPVEAAAAIVAPDGSLTIEAPPPGVWHLEIIDSTARQIAISDTVRGRIALQPAAHWSGYITADGALPTTLALAGTSRRAVVASDHTFAMDWLPPGTYRVLGVWGAQTREIATRRFALGEDLARDTLNGDSAEVDLVDLDRFPLRSALRGLFWSADDTISGRWFQTVDSSSRIDPPGSSTDPTLARREAHGIKFLRWDFRLGDKPININGLMMRPWAGVGLEVAPSGPGLGLDWRGVTSIRLRVRGSGVYRLQILSRLVDSLGGAPFGTVVSLDSTWRWLDIPVSSLWPDDGVFVKGTSWKEAASCVYALRLYTFQSDARLELADIRVRGSILPRTP